MNILIVCPNFWPDPRVGGTRASAWAQLLAAAGHNIHVAVGSWPTEYEETAFKDRFSGRVQLHNLRVFAKNKKNNSTLNLGELSWRILESLKIAQARTRPRFWTSKSVQDKICEIVEQNNINIIITSAPPHFIHFPILKLLQHNTLRVPWIADRQDGFMSDPRFRPKGRELFLIPYYSRFESRVYESADAVTHAIQEDWDYSRSKYPNAMGHVIENGFPDDLIGMLAQRKKSKSDLPVFASFGNIGHECISSLVVCSSKLLAAGLNHEINLYGPDRIASHPDISSENSLSHCVRYRGFLRHEVALERMVVADLLICGLEKKKMAGFPLSSKVLEYIPCAVPILIINPSRPDVRNSERVPWISTAQDHQHEKILTTLKNALTNPPAIDQITYDAIVKQFSRSEQVSKLQAIIDDVTQS